ncbi:MAG: hypothetical protein ABW189_03100 [Rickettsiales bacterium]
MPDDGSIHSKDDQGTLYESDFSDEIATLSNAPTENPAFIEEAGKRAYDLRDILIIHVTLLNNIACIPSIKMRCDQCPERKLLFKQRYNTLLFKAIQFILLEKVFMKITEEHKQPSPSFDHMKAIYDHVAKHAHEFASSMVNDVSDFHEALNNALVKDTENPSNDPKFPEQVLALKNKISEYVKKYGIDNDAVPNSTLYCTSNYEKDVNPATMSYIVQLYATSDPTHVVRSIEENYIWTPPKEQPASS